MVAEEVLANDGKIRSARGLRLRNVKTGEASELALDGVGHHRTAAQHRPGRHRRLLERDDNLRARLVRGRQEQLHVPLAEPDRGPHRLEGGRLPVLARSLGAEADRPRRRARREDRGGRADRRRQVDDAVDASALFRPKNVSAILL